MPLDRSRVIVVVAALGAAGLVAVAIRADPAAPLPNWWLTAADVAVGLAFVIAAMGAAGPRMERYVVATVGVTWLLGSFLPIARSWHQGVLLIALGWFASGRPRGFPGWLVAGVTVAGEAADASALLRLVALERPAVAIVDIRMPPTHTDEGLVAAQRIHSHYPGTAVVLLSQYLEPRYAQRLLADQPGGLGYLLKERVCDIAVLIDALDRVTADECVIDPTIVSRLMHRHRTDSPISRLSNREREILALMAEDRSNAGIAGELKISDRTVEAASAQLFRKLGLEPSAGVNRRVLAVLTLLRN